MTTTATTSARTANPFKSVFHYAQFCDDNFKRNTMKTSGREIQTTFCSDLSIGEWCQVFHKDTDGVEDTIRRASRMWMSNEDYIIDLLFAVNAKAWEHAALSQRDEYASMRAFTKEQHQAFSEYYSERYYTLLDEVMNYYQDKGDEDALSRIYDAID